MSKIHAISRGLVPTSGAGMSTSGPIWLMISVVKRLVMPSSSLVDMAFGLQTTPPLAPPKGSPMRAHFQVIHMASAFVSSIVTCGW